MQTGQFMKEHKAPFPIIVHVLQGSVKFGAEGEDIHLKIGDLIGLETNVPHDLLAKENSIVRLSLSKLDNLERVKNV
ncbi:MAG: AraC family ligand binding domain-containing protein [Crocinitomicaceae bacterium]